MTELKAIETQYKGYRFRSRLEARWAVFFTEMGIEWRYEAEGYQLPSGWYLPDFVLMDGWARTMFVEIKPGDPTHETEQLCFELAKQSGNNVLLLCGNIGCDFGEWDLCELDFKPVLYSGYRPVKSDWRNNPMFFAASLPAFLVRSGVPKESIPPAWMMDNADTLETYVEQVINLDRNYYKKTYGKEHSTWKYGIKCEHFFTGNGIDTSDSMLITANAKCGGFFSQCLNAARAARFEHGETP